MLRNRVSVDIMGRKYKLVSDKKVDYLVKVAKETEQRLKNFIEENPKLDFYSAAVLASLNMCDELMSLKEESNNYKNFKNAKAEEENSHIRSQLVEYSKELSKAENNIKRLEKELELIKSESKEREEKIKREYEIKEKEILDMLDNM